MTSRPWDVGRLTLLREVGRLGSIAAAARECGLTPSAVSQQLATLEREVGVALLERSSRGVALTAAGAAVAARAAQVLDVLAAARADLDRLGDALAGAVRLTAVASAATDLVSRAVTALAEEHPLLEVRVTVAEPATALQELVRGVTDVAVVDEYDYVPLAVPDPVLTRPLAVDPLVLVRQAAPPAAAPDAVGRVVGSLAELAPARWVMPPEDAACGLAVRSVCRAAGFEPDVRWVSDDMLVLATAVASGHGVAVLPALSVPAGWPGLRVDPLPPPGAHRRLTAVSRPAALARGGVGAVLDALVGAAGEGCPGTSPGAVVESGPPNRIS